MTSATWDDLLALTAEGAVTAFNCRAVVQVHDEWIHQELLDFSYITFQHAVATTKFNGLLPSLWAIHGHAFASKAFLDDVRTSSLNTLKVIVNDILKSQHPIVGKPSKANRLICETARYILLEKMLGYLETRKLVDPAHCVEIRNELFG